MPKYDVHVFRMVRIKMANIEADSQEAAVAIAAKEAPEELSFHWLPEGVECIDDTQEDAYYHVDEVGDEEYSKSRSHDGTFTIKDNQAELCSMITSLCDAIEDGAR